MAFLLHCLNRPVVRDRRGQLVEGPVRNGLPSLADALSVYYRGSVISPITARVRRCAEELRCQYGRPARLAEPLTLDDIRDFVSVMSQRPKDLRNKAALLLLCDSWCRPGELLRADYPACVRPSRNGIVLTVAHCKSRCGEPHFVSIAHTQDCDLCSVCALRVWIECLGADYVGPLFPVWKRGRPLPTPLPTGGFSYMLRAAARKTGRNPHLYSAYSTRRGAATIAASRDWELSVIQRKLWHEHVSQTLHYIGRDVLVNRTRSVLEP